MPAESSQQEILQDDFDLAAQEALIFATSLTVLSHARGEVITPAILFLALSEPAVPPEYSHLQQNTDARTLRRAISEVSSTARSELWAATLAGHELSTGESPLRPEMGLRTFSPKSVDKTVQAILQQAHALAQEERAEAVSIDFLIRGLLNTESPAVNRHFRPTGLNVSELYKIYLSARTGKIAQLLLNDAATSKDKLGYTRYVDAISKFILDPATQSPLSVSIQAPWGVGKSSLMQQLRNRIDPEAIRLRYTDHRTEQKKLKLRDVLKILNHSPKVAEKLHRWAESEISSRKPQTATPFLNIISRTTSLNLPSKSELAGGSYRCTVWFNAWKYENSTQVWAGLVDAIVSQISMRLPLIEREKFLLKLHLSRIDDTIVRKKIYDRIAGFWWSKAQKLVAIAVTFWGLVFGVKKASELVALPEPLAVAITDVSKAMHLTPSDAALTVTALTTIFLAAAYLYEQSKAKDEPAKFTLSEFITTPNYSNDVGVIHNIHNDIVKILKLIPHDKNGSTAQLVIFIDDLDRCTPSNIANVVEGVSMFLASDLYRCMFVIGMDPQMIAAALEASHASIVEKLPSAERTVPLGWRFMDKFVQLPFTIPPSVSHNLVDFIDGLARNEISTPPTETSYEDASLDKGALGKKTQAFWLEFIEIVRSELFAQKSGQIAKPVILAVGQAQSTEDSGSATDYAEQRDMGTILRALGSYTNANPRELKRMANLARFYLFLRNERNELDHGDWRPPSLQQYARWVALSCCWPDMTRWLLWGADEAASQENEGTASLVVRRLKTLERISIVQDSHKAWKAKVASELNVSVKNSDDWGADIKLYEFFAREASFAELDRLSAAYQRGFW